MDWEIRKANGEAARVMADNDFERDSSRGGEKGQTSKGDWAGQLKVRVSLISC